MRKRYVIGLGAFLAAVSLTGILGGRGDAHAYGWPCEPSWDAGQGPCYATMSTSRTSTFLVEGIWWSTVNWSTYSYTAFYAYAQSGHSAEALAQYSQSWTQSPWPSGTWDVANHQTLEGERFDWYWCSMSPCVVASSPDPGYNQESGDFNYVSSASYYPYDPYVDEFAEAKEFSGVYPAEGATFAYNNIYNDCRYLTPSGAQSGC